MFIGISFVIDICLIFLVVQLIITLVILNWLQYFDLEAFTNVKHFHSS